MTLPGSSATMMRTSRSPLPRGGVSSIMLFLVVIFFTSTPTQALRFLGDTETFAKYPKWNACQNATLSFEFRTRQPSALLVFTDNNVRYDYLQLALTKGAIRLWISFEAEERQVVDIEANTEALNDGQWHRVEIRRNRMETILYVDGLQTSKVALGTESDAAEEPTQNNYVFLGGIPSNYAPKLRRDLEGLPQQFFDIKFRGDIRNILYFNCSCIPVRVDMVEGRGVSRDPPEQCDVRNPCPQDCPCVSVDDGSGCECKYKRECLKDILASYHLPMDQVEEGTLVNPSRLDSVVEGGPLLTRGVKENALLIDGRSQWLRVTGGSHRRECMGDLARCEKGYYMGMWLQFRGAGYQRGVYLSNGGHSASNHGVALLYSKGRLDAIFKMRDGREWRARSHNVLEDRWYHVAATWSEAKGLHLYINGEKAGHDGTATQKRAASASTRYNGFYIGRANDNSGTDRLGQVLVDDFHFESTFKEPRDIREAGAIYHYYEPMDEIRQDRLVGGKGLDGRVYGAASRVDGKVGGAVLLSGGREYLDLGDVSNTCLGDLDLCQYGLYVSLWVLFNRVDGGKKTLLSSPAMSLHQEGNLLVASVNNLRQHWETRYQGLDIGAWYFVELSWSPTDGLSLYVGRQRVGYQPTSTYQPPEAAASMKLYVGQDGSRSSGYPAATFDELEMFYADRSTLSEINFIERGRPTNQHFDMDSISRGRLDHASMVVTLMGRPQIGPGKVGSAVVLDGVQDALDFGDRGNDCFGNLDLCPHGVLVSMWLKPERLEERAYFLSSGNNGLTMSYRAGKLQVGAATTTKTWEISTSDFTPDKWHFLEVSFHPERGLHLYQNGALVAESEQSEQRSNPTPARYERNRFYMGRGNVDMTTNKFGAGAYDELDVWYADRDYLTSQGFIQRSRPESVIVHFEESPDQTRIIHPTLDIRLIGRPGLIPGKVGNALQLRGRGQYADLGQLSHKCMGNLALCQQGITVSGWMKFRSFENNMVFLSSGEKGLLMYYRDGYMHVSADGRSVITVPPFETERWYHVEMSWHPDHGLKLFVDNKLMGEAPAATPAGSARRNAGHFYIGRPNDGDVPGVRYTTANFDVDELEVWSGRREDLLAFGYIERDELGHESFSMDSAQGDRLNHARFIVLLVNGARLGPGRVGQALQLNGRGQYLDLGPHLDSCLGNLDNCPHGFTLSVWLKPNSLAESQHFIAAPSYALFYEDGQLTAEFNSAGRSWTASTPRFREGVWQRVTLAWHSKKGLTLYLDDELQDTDGGVERLQRDRPASEHVFVGRSLADTRTTADVQADEMQVWYDYLDQLRATGQYQVEVSPRRITFDNFRDGYITLRDRRIQAIGNVQLVPGLGRDSRALYLDGRTQYLDLGSNFTCNGNLDTCKQGATFRFALKPDRLIDGTYFVDSFPVKLYYKDGRLYAEMQTKDRVWTVDTSEFRANQYSRVELSWHPTLGLTMNVNGRRVDYETFPRSRSPVSNSDWRTYLGRPLNEADGLYANAAVDNIEFYNAYSSYIPQDTYLQLIRDQPPYIPPTAAPPVTRRPPDRGTVTTQRPPVVRPDGGTRDRSRTTIVRFGGRDSYVRFNFDRLPPAYLVKTDEEEFSFWFLTKQPDGLIWFHDEPSRNLYIAMKDGKLVFVNDDKQGRPEEVTIGARSGRRFDDYRWHRLRIRKNGRRIRITVDDADQEEYIFSNDVQFLTPADVWLGGTSNTVEKTQNNIKSNFIGGVAEVNYISTSRVGQRTYRNEVDLIAQLGSGNTHGTVDVIDIDNPFRPGTGVVVPPVVVPTRRPPVVTYPTTPRPTLPPAPRTTSVTISKRGVVIPVPGMNMRSGSSVSFNFATINQDGLVLFAGDPGSTYMAVELVDGRLYFVHNFGRNHVRTPFSQRVVADGQAHEVEMRFYGTHVDLRVDDVRERLDLTSGERLPTNLGTMYVAGYPNYQQLPWMLWGRESYLGCLNDLRVDSRIVDFETQVQQLFGRVTRGCQAMPQDCTRVRPCANGECRNTMTDFLCDCSRTAFRGERCNLDAWTALFNGSVWAKLDFSRTQKTHADDISLRFRSPLKDGLLFETFAKGTSDFIRCSLENGRVKVETNLGGELKTMYAGENLNDFNWHTAYIKRRGNEMEVWVDDEPHTKATLAGSGYYMNVDRVYLGGNANSEENRYIGYLQNFHMGGTDVLEGLRGTGLNVNNFVSLPPLVYHPVTFPELNTFVELPPLRVPEAMALHFMFKTEESSGVMLFSSGSNQDYLVVEMFEGRLYIQLNTGGDSPLRVVSPGRVDDGKWHAVTIRRTAGDQRQFQFTVDGLLSSITYAGGQDLNLKGPLYIGGAPEELLERDYVKKGVFSRIGFRGCMASMDLSGQVPDLLKFAGQQGVTIFDTCQAIIPRACTADSCRHFGACIESGAGTFTCDCSMTAHAGVTCQDEPIGFRYRNFSSDGLLVYSFPQQPTSSRDEIAFGVMTKQNNAVLLRVFSELINDYIEFRVRDGYIVADYDTNGAGGKHTVAQTQVLVNDGNYHHVRFIRTPNDAQLFVDQMSGVKSTHSNAHGSFDRMSTMYIGGGYDARSGKIQNAYDGIIGGLHINDLMVFPQSKAGINTRYVGDVVEAPRPFNLAGGGVTVVITTPTPIATPKPPIGPILPPVVDGGPVVIPPGVGGGGAGWVPGPAGVDTVLYPGGTGGTAVLVPGPGAAAASGPVVSAMVATPPALPSSGPRAGAVVGTILGLMALGSSMMWAFYRCKPGYCACLKPPAAAPMAISSPRGGGLSASNKGAVIAAGGGGLGGAGAGAGASANAAGAGGAGAGGGGANSFSNFYMSQSSNSASAGGGGAGGASAVSGGGYSGYRESASHVRSASESVDGNAMSPASIQSYHYEGAPGSSTTADYDLATGVGSGYQSNTMSAGGGSMSGGTLGGGAGGFSSSTMQSSYNYSVKTVRTVSGQNQMSGYAGQGQIGVPPGALGEEVRVDCCLMTNDGHSVVTGSSLGPPQVWDMQSGELLRIMAGETVGSTNLHLACNDRLLVGAINADLEANQSSVPKGVHNYMLQIWDFTTGRALEMADVEVCSALTMMSDNDKVVFARSDKFGGGTNVVVWDLLGNQPIKHMRYDAPVGNNDYVHFIDLSQNDRYVVAGFTNSFDNFAEFVVFDMTLTSYTVSDPSILRLDANPECTAILPRDEAVTGLRNGDLVIWSLRTGQPSRQLLSGSGRHAHAREVKAVAVSEDNKYLVSASDDGTLKIWDVESERHINTLSGHTDEVWCCAISPDSEIVVSGSRDKTIRLWRLKNGSEICSFNAGVDIFHCTMSRDKSTIVALGDKMGARKLIMLQVVRTKVRRQVSS